MRHPPFVRASATVHREPFQADTCWPSSSPLEPGQRPVEDVHGERNARVDPGAASLTRAAAAMRTARRCMICISPPRAHIGYPPVYFRSHFTSSMWRLTTPPPAFWRCWIACTRDRIPPHTIFLAEGYPYRKPCTRRHHNVPCTLQFHAPRTSRRPCAARLSPSASWRTQS